MTEQVNKPKRTRKVATPEPEVMAVAPEELAVDKGDWKKVGDRNPQSLPSLCVAMPFDVVKTEAELKDQSNVINKYNISGKKEGVVVYVEDKACLYAALGKETKDAWKPQSKASNTTLVMGAAPATPSKKLGDVRRSSKHVAIPATSIPVVPFADLENQAHPINISALSGKKLGSVVFAGTNKEFICIAAGPKPTDKWLAITGDTHDLTPVGAPFLKSVGKFTGESARKVYQPIVTCVDFPVYKVDTELEKAGHIINISKMSGKRKGAVVIGIATDGTPDLFIAEGSAPTDKWQGQRKGYAATPTNS